MKEKLSALIIVMVIWFGVADITKNIEMLKSEADQLITKSSLYISNWKSGREPSEYVRTIRFAKREALIDESKNALCEAQPVVIPEQESVIVKTVNTNRQIISRKNQPQITINHKKANDYQLAINEIQRASDELERVADFDIDSPKIIKKLKEIKQEFYNRNSKALDERKADEKRLKRLSTVLPEILQKIGE